MNTKNNNLRIPPQSIDAEKALLGCVLIDTLSLSKAYEIINAKSFYNNNNATIFENMIEMEKNNEEIDNITITNQLNKNKILESIGGQKYIAELSINAPSSANVEYYANIIKEKQILREIINTSINMSKMAYDSNESPLSILDKAEQSLFELSKINEQQKFEKIEPLLHQVLDDWMNREKGEMLGISSGFLDLDNMLSGFQKSDFIVCAGRPSMGKTALALKIARNVAIESKKSVGVFSLEMSKKQLVERLIASEAKIDSNAIRNGSLEGEHYSRITNAADPLSKSKIYIDDSAGLSIIELRAKARQMKREKNVDLIIIDYIQLLNSGSRIESRQQEISLISRMLKALAKDLGIPIIALSQLSRAVENRTDHRPIMSDLRESGAIEQDADVILFIYRKYVYSNEEEDKGIAEIIIGKHRNGPTGVVNLSFLSQYATFENLDYSHQDQTFPA